MKIDALWLFSDAQAVTATAASTDYKNLEAAIDIGTGNDLYLVTVVDVAMTDAGSNSTITVSIETDDNSAFSSATTAETAYIIPALAAVGDTFTAKISSFTTAEQYMRLKYTTTGGDLTTGSFTSFVTDNIQKYKAYAKGYTISSANQF